MNIKNEYSINVDGKQKRVLVVEVLDSITGDGVTETNSYIRVTMPDNKEFLMVIGKDGNFKY